MSFIEDLSKRCKCSVSLEINRHRCNYVSIEDLDGFTKKMFGWIPIDFSKDEDKWHLCAFREGMLDGSYELIGEKINGNPERITGHLLLKHSDAKKFLDVPRDFEGIKNWLFNKDIEGLIFHHPDGRMAKIKKRDFGLKRLNYDNN